MDKFREMIKDRIARYSKDISYRLNNMRNDTETSTYEQNTIADLIVVAQTKAKLEEAKQLLQIYDVAFSKVASANTIPAPKEKSTIEIEGGIYEECGYMKDGVYHPYETSAKPPNIPDFEEFNYEEMWKRRDMLAAALETVLKRKYNVTIVADSNNITIQTPDRILCEICLCTDGYQIYEIPSPREWAKQITYPMNIDKDGMGYYYLITSTECMGQVTLLVRWLIDYRKD